jgi:hypothetical protein
MTIRRRARPRSTITTAAISAAQNERDTGHGQVPAVERSRRSATRDDGRKGVTGTILLPPFREKLPLPVPLQDPARSQARAETYQDLCNRILRLIKGLRYARQPSCVVRVSSLVMVDRHTSRPTGTGATPLDPVLRKSILWPGRFPPTADSATTWGSAQSYSPAEIDVSPLVIPGLEDLLATGLSSRRS